MSNKFEDDWGDILHRTGSTGAPTTDVQSVTDSLEADWDNILGQATEAPARQTGDIPIPEPKPLTPEEIATDELDSSLRHAATANPAQEAQNRKLARGLDLPQELLPEDASEQLFLKQNDAADLQRTHPAVARYMAAGGNAAIVGQNVEELKGIEYAMRRFVADPLLDLLKGAVAVPQTAAGFGAIARVGVPELVSPIFRNILESIPAIREGGDVVTKARRAVESTVDFKATQEILDTFMSPERQEAQRKLAEAQGFFPSLSTAIEHPSVIAGAVIQSVPSLGLSGAFAQQLMKQFPKLGALYAAAAGEGFTIAGSSAEQIRGETAEGELEVPQALLAVGAGAVGTGINILGGKIAQKMGATDIDTAIASGSLKRALDASGMPARLVTRVLTGAVGEGLEELGQSAVEQIAQNVALERPWDEGVQEAMAIGLLAGGALGGGVNLITTPPSSEVLNRAIDNAAAKEVKNMSRAQHAQGAKENLEAFGAKAAENVLRKESPEAFKEFVKTMADEDGNISEVYVDAEQLNESLAQSGLTPEELQQKMPELAQELKVAQEVQGEVRISIEDYATYIAGSPAEVSLLEHLRVSPEGMTFKESQEYFQQQEKSLTEQARQLVEENSEVLDRAEFQAQNPEADYNEYLKEHKNKVEAFTADAVEVHDKILSGLNETGRFTKAVNASYAIPFQEFFAVNAAREGVMPSELYARMPLNFRGAVIGGVGGSRGVLTQSEVERVLVAQHNLTEKNLMHAVRVGGLAAPSIAVAKKGAPLTSFGEITLLGSKALVDPKTGAKAFGADIYSPRYPKISYVFDKFAMKRLNAKFAEGRELTGEDPIGGFYDQDPEEMLRGNMAANAQFLLSKGRKPKVIRVKKLKIPTGLSAFKNDRRLPHELADDPRFRAAVIDDFKSRDARIDLQFDEVQITNLARGKVRELDQYQRSVREGGRVDERATLFANREIIRDKGWVSEYEDYITQSILDAKPEEKLFSGFSAAGYRRYKAHTLDNVIRELKRDIRGGEGFFYGLGSIRAKHTPQFKSIAQLKKSADRLMSRDMFELITKEMDRLFEVLDKSLEPYATFSGFDNAQSMLADAAKEGIPRALENNGFQNVPDEVQQDIRDFIVNLQKMPTEYFEVKLLRSVGLGEFSAAVVPDNTSPLVIKALKDNGITDIRKYKRGDDFSRVEAIGKFNDLFFQEAEAGAAPSLSAEVLAGMQATAAHDGTVFKTGKPVTFRYLHNKESATKLFGLPGKDSPFGRGFEPSGKFMVYTTKTKKPDFGDFELGSVTFSNPLVVANANLTWKKSLSDGYGGLTGARLSEAMLADGYDGVVTVDYDSAGKPHTSEILDLTTFDPSVALFQKERASFNPATFTISLLEGSDLSSVIHEGGHFYLEALADMASQPDAPEQVKADFEKTMKWFGIKDPNSWRSMTLDQKRQHHEQWAQSFERYALEGKAPTTEMQPVFARFRTFMLEVYQSIKEFLKQNPLAGKLNDEIRSVFDRLLAAEDAIKDTEKAREYAPLFATAEEAGATQRQFEQYLEEGDTATARAVDDLSSRSLRDMRWLSNAKDRIIKELQAEAKDKRAAIRAEVTNEVMSEPINQARTFLRKGEIQNENGTVTQADQVFKLGSKEVKALQPDIDLTRLRGMTSPDGVHPDLAAQMFGFDSGDALLTELVEGEKPKDKIDGLTDARMLEQHGDLIDNRAVERAAEKAIHNEARARFMATGLKMLTKSAISATQLNRAAKQAAESAIAQKKVREITPGQYARAETRANKEAIKKAPKDPNGAIKAQRAALLNNRLVKASTEAQAEVDRILKYLRKFESANVRKKLDVDYVEQIMDLLGSFDLRKGVTKKALDKRQSLADWIDEQEANGYEPAIDPALLDDLKRKHYKDMTLEELRGLAEGVKQVEHFGRMKKNLLTAKDKREFAERAEEADTSIRTNANRTVEERGTPNDLIGVTARWGRRMAAAHRKFNSIIREMDGGKDNGVMWNLFSRPMNESGDNETEMKQDAAGDIATLFKGLPKDETVPGNLYARKKLVPGTNMSMTHEQRVMFAMNWGNEGNRQRILDGGITGKRALSTAEVEKVLDTLTKADWDFVQGTWDYIGSFKEQVSALEKQLTGVEPVWVEATPVQTKFGTYKGGYFPAKYDTELSTRSESLEAVTDLRMGMRGAFGSAATRSGYVKARADQVINRPILLSYNVISQHISEVTHRIAWQPWIVDANRLLKALDQPIREHYGPEILSEMRKTVEDIAQGDAPAKNATESAINRLRVGSTIVGMGWRFSTALLQPSGLSQSMSRIGIGWVARGMGQFIANPLKSGDFVNSKSKLMTDRGITMNREINEVLNKIRAGEKVSTLTASYFTMIAKMQRTVDIPTWLGAYEKALKELKAENSINDFQRQEIDSKAVALADQAVIDSQSGGQLKDLARVQRGGPLFKMFTNFYSYFSAAYNLNIEAVRRTNFKSPSEVGLFAVDMLLINIVPVIFSVVLKEMLRPDCGEDLECYADKLAQEQIGHLMGQMIILREAGAAVAVATGGDGYGYQGPAGLRFFGDLYKAGTQVSQGEADMALFKAVNSVGGALLHYPAGQVNATLEGIIAIERGDVEGEGILPALLAGPPR